MTVEQTQDAKQRKDVQRHIVLLTLLVLLMRLPFLNQAVQGDDVYYLNAAYRGLIEPLHPNHTTYVFEGRTVNFQGYPHPPGNAWVLTVLLTIFGDVRETWFHLAYLPFSLIAVYGAYALALRFSKRPLWAALLFAVVPVFVVNGNSFESDVPLLAAWTAAAAFFIYGVDRASPRLLALSCMALIAAGLISMQSVLFVPILLAYLVTHDRWRTIRYALIACAPVFTIAAWQIFERLTSGVFPAEVTSGYLSVYGLEAKLNNVRGLTVQFLFLIFPVLLPFAVRQGWQRRKQPDTQFLLCWIGIFLAGAFVLFYAGSSRYLLPLALPLAILASAAAVSWLRVAVAVQCVIAFGLATVNYQQWNAYRNFAQRIAPQVRSTRTWVNGEWGLRHYLEANGALPFYRDQYVPTGDLVVESSLAYPVPILHGGRALVKIAEQDIRPALPFRIIGLEANSGFSTVSAGFLPYDIRGGLLDHIQALKLQKQAPVLSVLPMNSPEVAQQILSGVHRLEENAWRWMSGDASILLKSLGGPGTVTVKLYRPDISPARTVTVSVGGLVAHTEPLPAAGAYTVTLPVVTTASDPVTVRIQTDHTFSAPGDSRTLSLVLNEVSLAPR